MSSDKINLNADDMKTLFVTAAENGNLYNFGIVALEWMEQANDYIKQLHDVEKTFLLLDLLRKEKGLYISKHQGYFHGGIATSTWYLAEYEGHREYSGTGSSDLEAIIRIAEQVGISIGVIEKQMVEQKKFKIPNLVNTIGSSN